MRLRGYIVNSGSWVFILCLLCLFCAVYFFVFGLNFTLICKFAFNAKDKEETEKSKVPQIVCTEKYIFCIHRGEEEVNELQAIGIGEERGKLCIFPSRRNPITSFPGNFQSRAKCCQTEKSRFVCPATLACNASGKGGKSEENWSWFVCCIIFRATKRAEEKGASPHQVAKLFALSRTN